MRLHIRGKGFTDKLEGQGEAKKPLQEQDGAAKSNQHPQGIIVREWEKHSQKKRAGTSRENGLLVVP